MNLSTFWKTPKIKTHKVILKSGKSFIIKCENVKIEYSNNTAVLISYEFINIKNGIIPFYITPSEIAAILEIQ